MELAVSSLVLEQCLLSLGFLEEEEALEQELAARIFLYQARVRWVEGGVNGELSVGEQV